MLFYTCFDACKIADFPDYECDGGWNDRTGLEGSFPLLRVRGSNKKNREKSVEQKKKSINENHTVIFTWFLVIAHKRNDSLLQRATAILPYHM
jgi:hypothetical protein